MIDLEKEQAGLLIADQTWASIAERGELDQLWKFWAEDAVIYLANTKVLRGREAIRNFVLQNRAQPGFAISWEPAGAVVAQAGDMGYTFGVGHRTTQDENGQSQTITQHYVSIWRKNEEGEWQCIVET